MNKPLIVLYFACLAVLVLADNGEMDVQNTASDGAHAEFESTFKAAGNTGKLKFTLEVESDELKLQVDAFETTQSSASFYRARVEFQQIVQYTEVDGVPGYTPGIDAVNSSLQFGSNTPFAPITCSQTTPGFFTCNAHSSDTQFTLIAYITSTISNDSGVAQKPTSVKFSIDLNLTNRIVGTRVALILRAAAYTGTVPVIQNESQEQRSGFTHETEKEMLFGGGSLSWAVTAFQSGQNVTVINSQATNDDSSGHDAEEDAFKMIFSFDTTAAGIIAWDPKLIFGGVFANDARTTSASLIVMATALIAVLFF